MTAIPDHTVTRALAAYEALPELSGRHARMRAALEAIGDGPLLDPDCRDVTRALAAFDRAEYEQLARRVRP